MKRTISGPRFDITSGACNAYRTSESRQFVGQIRGCSMKTSFITTSPLSPINFRLVEKHAAVDGKSSPVNFCGRGYHIQQR